MWRRTGWVPFTVTSNGFARGAGQLVAGKFGDSALDRGHPAGEAASRDLDELVAEFAVAVLVNPLEYQRVEKPNC
jgi:hypothetical protein